MADPIADRRASQRSVRGAEGDLLANPLGAAFWWGLPLLAGFSTNFLPLAQSGRTAVWAVALVWMGVGCVLNARRCHRLHCYLSAPVLLLGAVGAAASGLGFTPLGPSTASYVINVSLALALASFAVEPIWGKYRSR
jgi:hypothetical protein